MKLYRHAGNIKAGLFTLGVILVICLLAYTQILVNELRKDNREIVRLYAGLIANVVKDDNDANLDISDIIILVNIILGDVSDSYINCYGDFNSDGFVSIIDIVGFVFLFF